MTKVEIDEETIDAIAVCGLLQWRDDLLRFESKNPEDRAADKMRVAAIELLLAYNGKPID